MKKLLDIPIVVENTQDLPFKEPHLPAGVTKSLLEDKRPNIAEIELTLFENCNIECDFCFHDKKSEVGMSWKEMQEKVWIAQKFMEERAGTVDMLQINIVGGELFQDRWMEILCYFYKNLAMLLSTIANLNDYKKFRIVWVSNFLFGKKEIIKDMIDELRDAGIDNHLIVSYDFDGRPMSKRYRKNIEWFGSDYIISVNLVGTVEAIRIFMEDKDKYFKEYLYPTYNIYFDDFIPDKGLDASLPPDSMIYEWYKFIADNYPKINPVATLLENDFNEMHCLSLNKLTIFPDNRTANCRWHRYDQDDFITKFDIHDNAGMMQTYIDEQGCLSCEYYQRCGLRCFTQTDWRNRERDMQDPKCPMKAFFNYVTKGIEYGKADN